MKRWGQVFLKDKEVALDIVNAASLTQTDRIVEIGPGEGVLTRIIAPQVKQLIAVEIDPRLSSELQSAFRAQSNVVISQQDILEYRLPDDLRQLPFKVVANVPYYITSPIVFLLLDWHLANPQFTRAIIMVQKEVARRLAAVPDNKDYGVISVMLQFYADVRILRLVKAASFSPVPKVDSAVIEIDFLPQPREKVPDIDTFRKIVKAAFAQRRKTVLNSLKHNYGLAVNLLEQSLKEAGIESGRRAETITIREFARLSEVIHEKNKDYH